MRMHGLWARSSPIVVIGPCPLTTRVSVGSAISFCRIEPMICTESDVPSSDGSPCHEVRPIEPAKNVSPGQQSFAPSNTYDVLPGVWPGQCRQRMDWPAIVRTSPS